MAECLLACNQTEEAEGIFRQAFTQMPGNVNAVVGLARCCRAKDDNDSAIRLISDFLAGSENNIICLNELGWWYKEDGMFDVALCYFAKVCDLTHCNVDATEILALVQLDLGKTQEALKTLQTGLRNNPANRQWLKLYTTLQCELGASDHLSAYQQLDRYVLPTQVQADYFYQLLKANQVEQAEQVLDQMKNSKAYVPLASTLHYALLDNKKQYDVILDKLLSEFKSALAMHYNQQLLLARIQI